MHKSIESTIAAIAQQESIPTLCGNVPIDVERLIETRMVVEANSGAGKSWAIRRLLEQTHGHVQHIVIDPEGEYHTLRERFDYVLAGRGGDCPATVKSAAMLARRVLELRVSVIVDISELGVMRPVFVRVFIDAIMNAPRELWHPVMIVIDEAGKFCPESDQAESRSSIINLMTTGRKRGFCGVLAAQRISTISKSALAECNNVMIGRTALDIDISRAASILGFRTNDIKATLKNLNDGQFFGFGPAIGRDVIKFTVGPVTTTHPRAGARALPPAPPTAKIREILGQLANIPEEAAEEAKTVEELRAEITKLRASNTKLSAGHVMGASDAERKIAAAKLDEMMKASAAERLRRDMLAKAYRHFHGEVQKAIALIDAAQNEAGRIENSVPDIKAMDVIRHQFDEPKPAKAGKPGLAEAFRDARTALTNAGYVVDSKAGTITGPKMTRRGDAISTPAFASHAHPVDQDVPSAMSEMPSPRAARQFLIALAQYREGLSKKKMLVHTGYASSGPISATFGALVKAGWIEGTHDLMKITIAGLAALGPYEPLPTGDAFLQWIIASNKLSGMEKNLLVTICAAYPDKIAKARVLELSEYKSSGPVSAGFGKLVALGYVTQVGTGTLRASEELFG